MTAQSPYQGVIVAFDYCTARQAFDYGGSSGASVEPVDEDTIMADVVTAASRAIDSHCRQRFSLETVSNERLRGVIDRDGVLTCSPPVPLITAITAFQYRVAGGTEWLTGSVADLDIAPADHGTTVRVLSGGLIAARGRRVDVQMSYTGGYATTAALPDDLAWAARAASWYEFQRRSAPMDRTAMPSLGIVVIPGDWPKHILSRLAPYCKVVPT